MVALFGYTFTVFLFCLFETGKFHGIFRLYIPNGNNVPDPCTHDPKDIWKRVGHNFTDYRKEPKNKPKNNFGKHFLNLKNSFANKSEIWNGTAEILGLCYMDSDGDSRSNGVELGDPKCKWTVGSKPKITNKSLLSHPGIPDAEGGIMTPKNAKKYCLG